MFVVGPVLHVGIIVVLAVIARQVYLTHKLVESWMDEIRAGRLTWTEKP